MSSIDILPSDDQQEIVQGLVRAIGNNPRGETGVIDVAELGFLGAALPTEYGGIGLTIADEILLHIEFGRNVADIRILAAMLAARLAALDSNADLCGRLAAGTLTAGFVTPVACWNGQADAPSGDVHLIGDADFYIALSPKGACLVPAHRFTEQQVREAMDAKASLTRAVLPPNDAARWTDTSPESLWQIATLAIAAQLVGIAAATRDMGAEYAKTREQFDKPIGAFQAIAHPLAECALRVDAAENQLYYAAIALRDGFPDAGSQVTAAWLVAMDAALRNATVNIQIHGAMGYSAITGAHLFLKRAVTLRHVAGGVRLHERAMMN